MQIKWRHSRLQTTFASADLQKSYDQLLKPIDEKSLGQIPAQFNASEIKQALTALGVIKSALMSFFSDFGDLTYEQGFAKLRKCAYEYKLKQPNQEPLYWVVDIVETEIGRQVDHRRSDIAKML